MTLYLASENISSNRASKLNQEEKAKNHCKLKDRRVTNIIRALFIKEIYS